MIKQLPPVILNDVVHDSTNSLMIELSKFPHVSFIKTTIDGYAEVNLEGISYPYFKNGGFLECYVLESDKDNYNAAHELIKNYYSYNPLTIDLSFSSIAEASFNNGKFGLVQLYPCTDHYRSINS